MGRKRLASRPEITIKPDLAAEDRKAESLYFKEHWSLISSGNKKQDIRISDNFISVNNEKYGSIFDGAFKSAKILSILEQSFQSLTMIQHLISIWDP